MYFLKRANSILYAPSIISGRLPKSTKVGTLGIVGVQFQSTRYFCNLRACSNSETASAAKNVAASL